MMAHTIIFQGKVPLIYIKDQLMVKMKKITQFEDDSVMLPCI